MPKILVQHEDFDLGAEVDALRCENPKIGAIATFTGLVRDINDGSGVSTLTLEHYPAMTQKALIEIVEQALTAQRHRLLRRGIRRQFRQAVRHADALAVGVLRAAGRPAENRLVKDEIGIVAGDGLGLGDIYLRRRA